MSNDRRSRREFMNVTGATVAGVVGAPFLGGSAKAQAVQAAVSGGTDPDMVVVNAKVYTVDPRSPRAEAFAITGGKFSAVGSTADIKGLAGKNTQSFDAKGMTIVPGFIDCHNHAGGETLLYDVLVGNPFEVEFVSILSIVGKLKARSQQVPPGTWVEGYFFDDTKVKDTRGLHRKDLDEVSKDHPVVVRHRGGHTSFYNSKAFEMAGITKDTPNPMGGTYDKDPDGQLNGRVTDRAMDPMRKIGTRPTFTAAENEKRGRDGIAHISKQFTRYGLTSVHHEGGNLAAIQDVRARGELLHRVSYEPQGAVLDSMISAGIKTGFGDEWIKFGATSEHRRGRLVLGADDGAQRELSRHDAALQGQRNRIAGRPECLGGARAPRRHPGERARQRRRGHRQLPDRRRARADTVPATRRAAEDHTLHAHHG